ncbi:MAG: hypothetical protein ACKO5A_00165, partial [Actinomycetota bacterium]
EPDLGQFFSADQWQFVQMAVATHQAVASVEAARGLDLRIGGPAVAGAGSDLLPNYLEGLRRAGLVPDFVSWHRYPNQFSAPDGPEDPNNPCTSCFAARNPFTRPDDVVEPEQRVRGLIWAAFPGQAAQIDTAVSEWNLSPGGLDLRNDTNEGAAFSAAALISLESSGVDFGIHYSSISDTRPGNYGLVDTAGERTPRYDVFRRFIAMSGQRVQIYGADANAGLWARATVDGNAGEAMISAYGSNPFVAYDRYLRIAGLGTKQVEASLLTVGSATFEPTAVRREGGDVLVPLPAQSVLHLRWTDGP